MLCKIIALIGPSGAGKGTIAEVFKEFKINRAISCTTRPKREWEKEGVDYFFKKETDAVFSEEMNKSPAKDFHRGVFYYTEESEFLKDEIVFCEMSKKGIKDLKSYFGEENVVSVYIYAQPETCRARIERRNGEDYAEKRMNDNYEEGSFSDIEYADYVIINSNDKIYKSKEIMRNIIRLEIEVT